jgi:hypothetical protein
MPLSDLIADAPVELAVDAATLAGAIEDIAACATACTACSAACLAEDEVADLRDCIATDDVCAEVCTATARVLSRLTRGSYAVLRAQLEACVIACQVCAEECRAHADHHEHCAVCLAACERAETAARELLAAVPA